MASDTAKGGLAKRLVLGVVAGALAGAVALAAQAPTVGKFEEDPVLWVNKVESISFDGPAFQSFMYFHAASAVDADGNMLWVDPLYDSLRLYIAAEKRVYTIGGSPGFRDGPAEFAQFSLRLADTVSLSVAGSLNDGFYVHDAGNGRIRKVARDKDGKWTVSTFAGDGSRLTNARESIPVSERSIKRMLSFHVMADGTWFIFGWDGILKVNDGKASRFEIAGLSNGEMPGIVSDKDGRLYFRFGRGTYWRLEDNDKLVWLCGTNDAQGKPMPGGGAVSGRDGLAYQATFWCPAALGVFPDGSALLVGGGDEHTIRKLSPISRDGRVSTLMPDGTWKENKHYSEGWQVYGGPSSDGCIYRSVWPWDSDYQPVRLRRIKGLKLW